MRLSFRPAEPNDVPALVAIYDRAYGGGYSACFDRYGPVAPQDFWWVQSEKAVSVIEINRRPAGLLIIGRVGRRLLAEEILLDEIPAGADESARRQVHDFLVDRFQRERQDALTVRCAETHAFVLGLGQQYRFQFANALVVVVGGGAGVRRDNREAPDGYAIRRATPADAQNLARLHEETLHVPARSRDLDGLFKQPDVRVFLAERERYPVGLAVGQIRDGTGRWSLGIREAHRRKGLGTALARGVLEFFAGKQVTPVSTYWGLDPAAARFVQGLGARTERTFLYLERAL